MSYCINKFDPDTLIKSKEQIIDESNNAPKKEIYPFQDFRIVMLAPSKKGKTVFVLSLLSTHLIKIYKHIFIIIPNRNSAYAGFVWPNHFLLANTKDDVDKQVISVIRYATKLTSNNIDNNRNDRVLLIFDDLGDTARFSLEVPKIFSMGRNINISAMFLAQTFSAVPSSLRPNVTHYCAFTYIMKDAEMIYSNSNSPNTKKDFTTNMRRFFESNKDARRVLIISVESVEMYWYESLPKFVEAYKNRYNPITKTIDPKMNYLQYQYSLMNAEDSKSDDNIFV